MRFLSFCFLLFSCLYIYCGEDSSLVAIREGEVYIGDYFAAGDNIEISGTVEGDVYVAGSQIVIDGRVEGDVIALGGSISVAGTVLGNLRMLGGQVTVVGTVERNATIIAANIQMPNAANVQGNVILLAGNADIAAKIRGNARVIASNLRVSSWIYKNLDVYVGNMRLASKTKIEGDLNYRSSETASIDPSAQIMGKITYHPSLFDNILDMPILRGFIIGSKIAGLLMNFLYTFVIGWVLIRMFPKKLESTLYTLQTKPMRSLAFGVILLIVLPLVSLLLLMTVLGAPFALTLIALNIVSFYTAKVFSILWASNWLFSKIGWQRNKMPTLAVGQVCYYILASVPFLGTCVVVFSMLFGLGAAVLSQAKH